MDRYKFRAWGIASQKMYEPKTLEQIGTCMPRIDFGGLVMMQYAGLHDNKNDKEIYEGDICKCKRNDGHTFVGKIIYDTDIASFVVIQNGYTENIYAIEYFEVIGNIYESPELLK